MEPWSIEQPQPSEVVVTFRGVLTADAGRDSAAAMTRVLAAGPVDVVFNVEAVERYVSEARLAWQETVWPLRNNIRSLALVGGAPIMRLGFQMFALAVGAPMRAVHPPMAS